jgi:hypothetical protein
MQIRRKKTILEQATDYVEAAVEKAGPILADAKDKAVEALADAKDQAAPALADAKDKAVAKAGPALADARDKATPLIAQGAALAAQKASQGKDLAAAKSAELTGHPKPKKHRLRKLLILTGIAALLGFAAKKMRDSADEENWQSSDTPTPPPSRTETPIADAAAAASGDGADEGGAGPDEALADAVEEQHRVTTPDQPADVVEVADEPADAPAEKK